jgi:Family of unknown function (DUF5681)
MARPPKRPLPGLPAPATATYEVGYTRPPAANRFKPGKSGNPRGRPKGARNKLPALNEERLKSIVIAEAYRTIKVNDGPRQVSVPMAQAIVRSLALNAVKGQHRAQRLFSELLSTTERENKALHDEWLSTAMEYKAGWEKEIERCRQIGLPLPDPVPHPDHIDLDMRTGQVLVDGPMTYKQRDGGRQLVAKLLECRRELAWLAKTRAKSKDPRMIEIYDQEIVYEKRIRDILTDGISRTPWLARELVIAAKADALKHAERRK